MRFSAYFCRRLMDFPNVRLFDFRGVSEVTHDLNNYSDVIHHSPDIDLKVLNWLARGQYRVDASAPTASLDQLKAQVEAYRVERVEHNSPRTPSHLSHGERSDRSCDPGEGVRSNDGS